MESCFPLKAKDNGESSQQVTSARSRLSKTTVEASQLFLALCPLPVWVLFATLPPYESLKMEI